MAAQPSHSPIDQLHAEEARWFAIYTGFKREKWVQQYLTEQGVECFVPIMTKVRRYASKTKKVRLPLISCYAFVKIKKDQYITVLETPDVFRFVRFAKDLLAIPEKEMNTLKRVVQYVGVDVEVVDSVSVKLGDTVEISEGQLIGLQGKVAEIRNKNVLLIHLEMIGQTLAVEVPKKSLRPLLNQV